MLNLERPRDFAGHSLSVSDIVAFRHDNVVSYHYCDSVGFEEVPAFQKPENYLKAAEMSMEDDYGMIDGIINNGPKDQGPPRSEPAKDPQPQERMSLRDRLREKSEQIEQTQVKKERKQRDERSI